jgi:hypothetical protein
MNESAYSPHGAIRAVGASLGPADVPGSGDYTKMIALIPMYHTPQWFIFES